MLYFHYIILNKLVLLFLWQFSEYSWYYSYLYNYLHFIKYYCYYYSFYHCYIIIFNILLYYNKFIFNSNEFFSIF